MRFLLNGYGTGSVDGEAKQYKTLRGRGEKIEFLKTGVISNGKKIPCIAISGVTTKRSKDASNNPVSVRLFDLSAEEALELSTICAEYAYSLGKQTSIDKTDHSLVSEISLARYTEATVNLLKFNHHNSLSLLLEKIESHWLDQANFQKEKVASYKEFLYRKISESGEIITSTGKPKISLETRKNRKAWYEKCANSMDNLLRLFVGGDGEFCNAKNKISLVRDVPSKPIEK